MPTNWMPESITQLAKQTDSLFLVMLATTVVAFVLVEFLLIFFLLKYRRTKKNQQGLAVHGNTRLEIIWTLVPAIILVGFGIYSTQLTYNIQTASANDAYEIQVTGRKWSWEFTYPNGASTINELHVPQGKNVVLKITSADVIHSFWLPDARIKQDAVPGRLTEIHLTNTQLEPGKTYRVICAEYCGADHTNMLAKLQSDTPADFEKFLADAKKASEEGPQAGQKLATQFGCLGCHAIDGSTKVGPSWKGLYGKDQKLTNGSTVKVDDKFIEQVINNPSSAVPEGFQPTMPPFAGKLDDKQMKSIIEYMKTLK
ncbi:cytochrome c oxidase subunit II [Effusibacillus dendaii]|uniref:Cytochrome c oxidase subunit 2 n=1 Tax=Effusibacillus dendaii TaxID=2743772 RepID=A0A7I8DC14_9BACL|nr:cytochrome c oxidase subunit II [Effusibacillus dendaii]BCJ86872.1 cytochrome c oxidase subunit 2 [Effusibacillus dendaii]